MSDELIDFSDIKESFTVHHNKDYTTTALWIVPIKKLLDEMAKMIEENVASEKLSSSSQDELSRPCTAHSFSTPDHQIEVTVGLQLNPNETRRRGQASDYLLTIFYMVSSKNPSLDGKNNSFRRKNFLQSQAFL